MLQLKLKKYLK